LSTVVYGLGESGIAATQALLARGEDVRAADAGDDARLRGALEELGVEGVLGAGPEVLNGADRVVVSPGIRPRDAVLRAAAERRVPVISEVALGLELLGPGVRVAAITGTNGKTTVVDMLHRMLDGVPGGDHRYQR
jgi:UDP-N-acetylmuramoylalanine--D-glutamate ligase